MSLGIHRYYKEINSDFFEKFILQYNTYKNIKLFCIIYNLIAVAITLQ